MGFFFRKGYYSSSNTPVTSQNLLQDEIIEDRIPSSIEIDNSEDQLKQENHTSPISHVASAPVISTNIDIPTTNDSSTIGNCSLGKQSEVTSIVEKENDSLPTVGQYCTMNLK